MSESLPTFYRDESRIARAVARPPHSTSGGPQGFHMLRIELDDLARPQVIALLEEHLRNMYELSPLDQVFAFDASKLKAPAAILRLCRLKRCTAARGSGFADHSGLTERTGIASSCRTSSHRVQPKSSSAQ
jgi:hypothetical protein